MPNGPMRIEVAHQVVGDGLEAERPVDAQARAQLVGLEHLVGVRVDPGAELRARAPPPSSARRPGGGRRTARTGPRSARARRACRSPGCCGRSRARRRRRSTGRWRACGTRRPASRRRCRSRRGASPSPPTTSTLWAPTAGSVSIAFLACDDELGFLLLAAEVLVVRAAAPAPRASSPSASSVASSRRVAMSGVLMRPAALTRGASMNATW